LSNSEFEELRRRAAALEHEVERLRAGSGFGPGAGPASRQDRYQTLFDAIDEGFCVIEFFDGPHGPLSDYIHVEANPAYTRHAGIPNVVGQKVREMVPTEADEWVARYREVLVTGKPIRFEQELVATGRHLELAAFRIEPPSLKQVAVLFQDVSARKRAENELQKLNEELEARVVEAIAERKVLADLVENTNALVHVVGLDFRWIALNSAAATEFERAFGVLPKVGDHLLDLMQNVPDRRAAVRAAWERAFSGEEFVQIMEVGETPRDRRYYEMHFNVLREASGKQIGAYEFVYDVTERLAEQERLRIVEVALRQSQKMEAVGQLTGGIAHDFNNMLAVIISSLRLAERRLERGDTDIRQFMSSALAGADRAANLVSRLLAFSRQQPLAPQRTDANRLLGGMEEVLRRTIPESIQIELVRAGGLWPIQVDAHGLENAVLNLAVNARDAMPGGGKLTIETAHAYLDEAYAAAHAEIVAGQYVQIAITDTGHGMALDVISRAFEPFFTTKQVGEGSGLGLSQVYGFVKQSGGHVKIYSEVGVGTTVKIYIPRVASTFLTSPEPTQSAGLAQDGAGQLVLLVEDDGDVRRLTLEILAELGYAVVAAEGGARALELLDEHPEVALLLTDVVMPGMNGRQLAEEARRRRPEIKVLFTTGYTRNAIVHNGTLDEGVELVVKPFTLEVLAAKVAKLLAQGPSE
jgi:signal transduction histidine kinase